MSTGAGRHLENDRFMKFIVEDEDTKKTSTPVFFNRHTIHIF